VKAIIQVLGPSAVVALCAVLTYIGLHDSREQKCWAVPAMVTVPVWVQGETNGAPRVCEDTLGELAKHNTSRPMCWEMIEKRGKECERE